MKIRHELNDCLYSQKTEMYNMPEYVNEPAWYTNVQNGDIEAVRQTFQNVEMPLLSNMHSLSKNQVRNAMYHFVIVSLTLAKACIESGLGHDEAYTITDIYICKADKCKNVESICKLYQNMCLDFTERMCEIRKEAVISLHIRKCINYIYDYLGSDLSVKTLAEMAGLNPTYLSRLFLKETGIPIKQFIAEAKIDTAMNLLKYSDITYSKISVSLGFSSQSAFISVFKKITGLTPKVYRDQFYSNRSVSNGSRI